MKSIDLKVHPRKSLGKKDARNLRREGNVPCVLYGGDENHHFFAHENTFKNLVFTHNVYLIHLDIEGDKRLAIVKELQLHPVTDKVMHIDFQEVSRDKMIIIGLPVEITGSSVGVKAGGKLRQRKRYIRVKGLIENMPDTLKIDITDLDIGQSFKAGDLKYDKLEVLEPTYSLVVGVVSSRVAAKSLEPLAEAAEAEAEEEKAEEAEETKE
ncbi:MAG: 50S ribosomal protein L25 [Bacteroidales bacterium]|nr:50S ribosomal protein L25 [Bacteroidales bacterium]